MDHNHCLNCGAELHGQYCANCGQAAATHKFSVNHIFTHDLAHGVFHLDRGFFYTVKEIIRRPGAAIREYIEGKRVNHYNYFAFIILMVAVNHLILTSSGVNMADMMAVKGEGRDSFELVWQYMEKYQKLIVFGQLPIAAFSSFLFFKKSKLNYAEHLVLNTYLQGGILVINAIATAIAVIVYAVSKSGTITYGIMVAMSPVVFIYIIRFYWQFFHPFYKNKWLLVYRSMQAYAVSKLFVVVILLVILQVTGVHSFIN